MARQQKAPFWLQLGSFLVRIGLGVAFFWNGNDLLTPPLMISKLESRLGNLVEIGLVTPSTVHQVFQLIGHVEVAAGLLLIIGLFTRPAAVSLAGLLAIYLLRTGAHDLFEVKDAALLGAAVALALSGSGFFSLDGFLADWGPVKRMASPAPRWLAMFGPTLLRTGMAVVFLWSGVHMMADPRAFIQELAQVQFIPNQPPFNQLDMLSLVMWTGITHVIIATSLFLGFMTKPVAVIVCVFIGALMTRLGVFTLSMVKDLALVGAALSLAAAGPGAFALDTEARQFVERLRKRRRSGTSAPGAVPG